MEACALDRPVVVLTSPGVWLPREYEAYGAARFAATGEELAACIADELPGGSGAQALAEGRQRLIDDMFAGLVAGADRRIADGVLALGAGAAERRMVDG